MSEPRFPRVRLVGTALLVAWLGPAVAWIVTRSVPAVFLTVSILYIFLGSVFLFLCLPLGRFISYFQRERFALLPVIVDPIIRHFLHYVGWPRSSRGWTLACITLAGYFWVVAVLAFFWATGNTHSEHVLLRWIERIFHTLF